MGDELKLAERDGPHVKPGEKTGTTPDNRVMMGQG